MGAPAIFAKQIEIKLLHSASTLESRIQVEDKKRFETTLWHRPVYLHKQSHEPVSYGDCERYGHWVHDFDSSSGLWQNVSESKREYRVWINQYAITDTRHLKNQGALYLNP
jgi:hypothetical protein